MYLVKKKRKECLKKREDELQWRIPALIPLCKLFHWTNLIYSLFLEIRFFEIQPHSLAIDNLWLQSSVIVAETFWPAKLKIFIIWSSTQNICQLPTQGIWNWWLAWYPIQFLALSRIVALSQTRQDYCKCNQLSLPFLITAAVPMGYFTEADQYSFRHSSGKAQLLMHLREGWSKAVWREEVESLGWTCTLCYI